MKKTQQVTLCLLMVFAPSISWAGATVRPEVRHEGIGRATAAVSLGEDLFVTASAQDNRLRLYRTTGPSQPVASFDLSDYLETGPGVPVDMAGATKVGDRIYWIASHSRDDAGRVRPERYRFFATTVKNANGRVTIEPVGKPYDKLVHRLLRVHTIRGLRLDKATRLGDELTDSQRRRLAPAREGLSIEALCASHEGDVLYIGFRNPRPMRVITGTAHALVVPLDNAADVLDRGEEPIFGEGMLWDFEGLGITSFEYAPSHRAYFILAAPHDEDGPCVLYRWSGMKADAPEAISGMVAGAGGFVPTAIVPFENERRLLLLGTDTQTNVSQTNVVQAKWWWTESR